jgi:hypothetical protein
MVMVLKEAKSASIATGRNKLPLVFRVSRVHSNGPQPFNHTANLKKIGPEALSRTKLGRCFLPIVPL